MIIIGAEIQQSIGVEVKIMVNKDAQPNNNRNIEDAPTIQPKHNLYRLDIPRAIPRLADNAFLYLQSMVRKHCFYTTRDLSDLLRYHLLF